MDKYKIKAIQDIYRRLDRIIDEKLTYSSKIRRIFGDHDQEFYLERADESDMSIQLLINYMLQDYGHYRKLLSKETYQKVKEFNKSYPDHLYYLYDNDEQMLIDTILYTVICGVRMSLKKNNIPCSNKDLDEVFNEESSLPHISKYGLIRNTIINKAVFLKDLEKYISIHNLTQDDKEILWEVLDESGSFLSISQVLCDKYPLLSKEITQKAIKEE